MAKYFEVMINTGNGCTKQFYTIRDIVQERQRARDLAEELLHSIEDKNIRHIVYYRDERDNDGVLTKAHFYFDMFKLTDEQFYGKWDVTNGTIGAVHRR